MPPAAIRTAAEVMAAVRARGWTDALWEEVGRLRSDADVVRIFQAYDGEVCVCVCVFASAYAYIPQVADAAWRANQNHCRANSGARACAFRGRCCSG